MHQLRRTVRELQVAYLSQVRHVQLRQLSDEIMNKATEKAFQVWFVKANNLEHGQLHTISHKDGDLSTFIEEALRRAFTAGANWERQK